MSFKGMEPVSYGCWDTVRISDCFGPRGTRSFIISYHCSLSVTPSLGAVTVLWLQGQHLCPLSHFLSKVPACCAGVLEKI